MTDPRPPHRLRHSPAWAARLIQAAFAGTLVLGGLFLLTGWRCAVADLLLGMFGLSLGLLGACAYAFGWPLPRRYRGGYFSPTSQRRTWLLACGLMLLLGGICLLAAAGLVPARVRGCI